MRQKRESHNPNSCRAKDWTVRLTNTEFWPQERLRVTANGSKHIIAGWPRSRSESEVFNLISSLPYTWHNAVLSSEVSISSASSYRHAEQGKQLFIGPGREPGLPSLPTPSHLGHSLCAGRDSLYCLSYKRTAFACRFPTSIFYRRTSPWTSPPIKSQASH